MVPFSQHDSSLLQMLAALVGGGGGGGILQPPPQSVVEQEKREGGGGENEVAAANAVAANNNNSSSLLSCLLSLNHHHLASQQQHQQLHNLIPLHLQARAAALSSSLHGTPGHQPALIPMPAAALLLSTMTAATAAINQDNPSPLLQTLTPTPIQVPPPIPVYNGVNPHYPGLRVLHTNPPLFGVDDFLTPLECDFLISAAQDSFGPAPVVGRGINGELSLSRTSSTCYLAREDVPDLLRKVSLLTGKPMEHVELPQVGRYFLQQQYLQHYDAFDLTQEDGRRFAANGGQRTVTCLIYLNSVAIGGATHFPALQDLKVQPKRGMCVVFFPATIDGVLDKMALHAALPAVETKYVSQVWIRQGNYNGLASKRLQQIMGSPLSCEEVQRNRLVTSANGIAGLAAASAAAAEMQRQQQQQQALLQQQPMALMPPAAVTRF